MARLPAEPPAPVRSLPELLGLALALEQEAERRHGALALRMDAAGMPGVAAVFRRLAGGKARDAREVATWARQATGTDPDPTLLRWPPPAILDEEEAREIASSRLTSGYCAYALAVRGEDRAFAFWAYVSAATAAADVRDAAEWMARQALHRAALLRRERRRLFHEERGFRAGLPSPPPLMRALTAERQLATLLSSLAAAEREAAKAATWRRLAEEAAAMAAEIQSLAVPEMTAPASTAPSAASSAVLHEAWRCAEQAAQAQLDAADAARDEEQVRRLQALAERAIVRVGLLRNAADPAPGQPG